MNMHSDQSAQVVLYTTPDGETTLDVLADDATVWLTRQQLATLFGRDVKTIGKHVSNARGEELEGMAVVAKFATTAADGKIYQVEHYNLDMILSVGYRVKSAEGVHFRRWATDVLQRYLAEGAALNQRRLDELGSIVKVLARSTDQLVAGVAYLLGLRRRSPLSGGGREGRQPALSRCQRPSALRRE
ncbi:virulence RhuM family protein [Microbacterium sp. A93]|uniref:virulence RhuM family protein n=1 Tax=Microbacterium sp. A93 TaxID=3450716 RepID=UPI003F429FC5